MDHSRILTFRTIPEVLHSGAFKKFHILEHFIICTLCLIPVFSEYSLVHKFSHLWQFKNFTLLTIYKFSHFGPINSFPNLDCSRIFTSLTIAEFLCCEPFQNIYIPNTWYKALQDIVYIRLSPGINFGISLKRSKITQMGYFWSPLDS